jgi:sporulation protein YlmC with PRC-barrel domain
MSGQDVSTPVLGLCATAPSQGQLWCVDAQTLPCLLGKTRALLTHRRNKTMTPKHWLSTLSVAAAIAMSQTAHAQVAGSTLVGISVTEATQIAAGWSATKSILGKNVYNDSGHKVGKVQDLIIAPDRKVSYLIIGVGGFVGIGQRDVAIPVTQVHEQDGKITINGATKDALKAMPAFVYAKADTRRQQIESQADRDIGKGQSALTDLQKRSSSATGEAKARLDAKVTSLQQDLKATQDRLADMRKSTAATWQTQEEALRAASVRLVQTVNTAVN